MYYDAGFPRGRGGGIGFERQTSERGWSVSSSFESVSTLPPALKSVSMLPPSLKSLQSFRFDRNDRSAAREEELNGGVSPRKGYTRYTVLIDICSCKKINLRNDFFVNPELIFFLLWECKEQ